MAAKDFQVRINNKLAVENPQLLANLFRDVSAGKAGALEQLSKLSGEKIETDVVLRVNADTGQSERVITRTTKSAREFDAALKRASKSATGSLTSLRAQARTAAQLRDSTVKYVTVLKTVRGLFGPQVVEVRKISNEWKLANAEVNKYQRLAKKEAGGPSILGIQTGGFKDLLSLGNKFTQITAAATAVVSTIQAITGAVDVFVQRQRQIAGITLALTSFGVSSQGASDTLVQAKNIALTYGASLAQLEQAYKRLTPVILNSGGSLEQTDAVVSSLAARTTALGLNTEQSGRYIEAFAQVLGKGKLQSEELNQQFSELDGALRGQLAAFIASEYGITNLEDAMKNGQITAKIFTEFMIEAGEAAKEKLATQIGEAQQSIDKLNPQQIQNITDTLNTISIESLGNTLAGTGRALASIQLAFSQWFASLTSNFPLIAKLAGGFFQTVAELGKGAVQIIIIGFQTIAIAVETALNIINEIIEKIRSIPGVQAILNGLAAGWAGVQQSVNRTVDELTKINPAITEQERITKEYTAKAAELWDQWAAGKITLDELKAKTTELRKAQEFEQQKAEAEQLKTLLESQKTAIDSKIASIDKEIEKTQAAFDRRKLALEEEKRLIEAPYLARAAALDDEARRIDNIKAKILEKYALERGQIDQLQTVAKEAQLAVERDELAKLQLKKQNATLSAEEARQLDAQIKQKQASIAQSEYELKVASEMQSVKADEEKNEAAIAQNKRDQAEATKDVDAKSKDLEQQEKDRIGNLKLAKAELEEQASILEGQIESTQEAITEMDNLKNKVKEVGTELKNLSSIKVNVSATSARALGGPVTGGRTYQVNELGKEAFLSSSGRLSMIKAPAFGMWRAPSSGTVIPAHITEQLVDANSTYSIAATSQAPKLISKITNTNQAQGYSQLARSQASMAVELGRLSQAVTKISSKEWVVDVNIGSGNPLLNRLKRV